MLRGRSNSICISILGENPEPFSFRLGDLTGLSLTCCPQELLQQQEPGFRNDHPGFPMRECVVTVARRVVNERPCLHVQFETEAGDPGGGPSPERVETDFRDNSGSLPGIEKSGPVVTDIGRVLIHRDTKPNPMSESKSDIRPQTIDEWWDQEGAF